MPPLQGCVSGGLFPRALPWAILCEPFRLQRKRVYLQLWLAPARQPGRVWLQSRGSSGKRPAICRRRLAVLFPRDRSRHGRASRPWHDGAAAPP